MTWHTQQLTLNTDGAGSAAGTIGCPPEELAGVYYDFNGTLLNIQNQGRSVFSKSGPASTDGLQQLAPKGSAVVALPIINGDAVVSVAGAPISSPVHIVIYVKR